MKLKPKVNYYDLKKILTKYFVSIKINSKQVSNSKQVEKDDIDQRFT